MNATHPAVISMALGNIEALNIPSKPIVPYEGHEYDDYFGSSSMTLREISDNRMVVYPRGNPIHGACLNAIEHSRTFMIDHLMHQRLNQGYGELHHSFSALVKTRNSMAEQHYKLIAELLGQAYPSEYFLAFKRIEEFANEEEDWDGCGGLPASENTVRDVKSFLNNARAAHLKEPGLAMGGDGSVAVVWEEKEKYITADFSGDEGYVFLISELPSIINTGNNRSTSIHSVLLDYLKKYFTEDDC